MCALVAEDIRVVANDPVIVRELAVIGKIVSPSNATEFAASIEQQRAQATLQQCQSR